MQVFYCRKREKIHHISQHAYNALLESELEAGR